MFEIKESLKKPDIRQDLSQLGLAAETSRFLLRIDRYEQAIKPGASPADRATQLIHEFHAWEDFTIEVRHAYKSNPELRQTLLEAFEHNGTPLLLKTHHPAPLPTNDGSGSIPFLLLMNREVISYFD